LVREVYRILKPDGRFFITTPNVTGFQALLFGSRWRSAIFDHLYLFSKTTLPRLLKQNVFSIEKIATWGGLAAGTAPTPVKHLFDKAVKCFGFGDVMVIRAKKRNQNKKDPLVYSL
jgi:SAM-dependent methyltransferase